ncbi:MAG TPA: hypothetical protein VNL37_02150 [Candidatus Polarisedimenticolia bacterium]|nr:hypothetical protein [Candidatus Polarisedimenticolia bacterium]
MTGLAIFKAMLIAAVLFVALLLLATIDYRLTQEAVEILILRRVVRRVPLADIEEVHRRGALLHENWSGPKFWNAVTLRRRRGLLRNLVISPDEPDRFVARLQELLDRSPAGSHGGWNAEPPQ